MANFVAMNYGVANLSLIPCRAEAADQSEIVTQLLFGDPFEIIEEFPKWLSIRIADDQYVCFIDKKQCTPIDKTEFERLSNTTSFCYDLVSLIQTPGQQMIPILLGSRIPEMKDEQFILAGQEYSFEGALNDTKAEDKRAAVLENAFLYLNAPYLWGGKSPYGIDCSGFTQMVYKLAGDQIPRDAWQQAELGETLSFVEEAQVGDLAFFDNEDGRIIHVGIMLDNRRIIHASGKVRIDKIDHQGIFNEDSGTYSHNLRLIKRFI